jgi:CRISPR-associated endonuclease/helicase Cas3
MQRFYSHLAKRGEEVDFEKSVLLKNHLREAGFRTKEYFFFEGGDLKSIGYYVGITHDFGKYTTYFQKRLFEIEHCGDLANHGFISSLYSSYLISKRLQEFKGVEDIKEFLPIMAFFVVYHHHLDLSSLSKLRSNLEDTSKKELVLKQIEDMKSNSEIINEELKELGLPLLEEFENDLDNVINLLRKRIYQFENKLEEEVKGKIAIFCLALFSALIDADKKSAGKVKDVERRDIPEDIVEIYKRETFKGEPNEIDLLREEIFQKVVNKVREINIKKNKIFTFTSPTGSGKTLTGFAFALKLRKRIEREFGYTPRIIYSLPFISIINQNYNVLRDVLSKMLDFEGNSSAYIISHHHLSKIEYEEGDELKEVDESLALIESWESEVIVTTFVQLLHTIIGFKNNFLKKYHNIARSIIILDEVQNIPAEYWKLTERVFKLMSQYLNCYVILMTATKPLIFSEEDTIEILEDNEIYFEKLNRVVLYSNVKEQKGLDSLLSWFIDIYDPEKSYMIVLNTINSSIEFYRMLKDKSAFQGRDVYYLSANIIPKERLNRILRIKEDLNNNKKPILVSTQVVEAGVDLDFDVVIRDLGPLDSVVQVSGRCNRNFKRKKGEVFVFFLKNENGRSYANMVYQKLTPRITLELFSELSSLKESEFIKIINKYFERLRFEKSQEESELIISAFNQLRFYEGKEMISVSSFELIKEKGIMYPVFVELDKMAMKVWSDFKNIIFDDSIDKWEKKKLLLNIKSQLEQYIVNVRVNEKESWIFDIAFDQNIGYVSNNKIPDYYDLETGFKKTELSSVIF